jgi:hypothetical protein
MPKRSVAGKATKVTELLPCVNQHIISISARKRAGEYEGFFDKIDSQGTAIFNRRGTFGKPRFPPGFGAFV